MQLRRQRVTSCLERYLSADELADYRQFVHAKARLIVDARQAEERMRLAEEQLAALARAATAT